MDREVKNGMNERINERQENEENNKSKRLEKEISLGRKEGKKKEGD